MEMRGILSVSDDYVECADCGSRGTRSMGNYGVRNDECSVCRSAIMGHQYAPSVRGMVLFKEKITKNLRNCKIFCNFVADFVMTL